jgi:hypothetical protein
MKGCATKAAFDLRTAPIGRSGTSLQLIVIHDCAPKLHLERATLYAHIVRTRTLKAYEDEDGAVGKCQNYQIKPIYIVISMA